MNQNEIKFSHLYYKMEDVEYKFPITLLDVFVTRAENLTGEFKEYDTKYFDGKTMQNYKLPKTGEVLILLFLDHKNRLFTTVRTRYGKNKQDKFVYYKQKCGQRFKVNLLNQTA
ncbi:MAG: hypothetical protein H7A25_22410 [Leptospiraceae bacterium]|nr:hypothetical protein [Leptospiraceae bacterium]MCP5502668.1 hypothetical protein [Leptospiraceae bacterium]